jgi:hypothetical protein
MSKKKIAWEKWDTDLIEEEILEGMDFQEEDDEEMIDEALKLMQKIPKLISTPMGIYQLHDKMNPVKQFDCWTGYTNFDITHSIQSKIESVEGVELLAVLSRYRFFLGVGKLFKFKNVRAKIEQDLYESDPESFDFKMNQETQETVDVIREIISQDKYWAIFVSHNGEIEYSSTNKEDDQDHITNVLSYGKLKKEFGGKIFQHDPEIS